ncbi:phage antirepressor KilAC domain-containing protein [Dyadobacter bucti]|uniref:phage antirepressor KilAC domain-containing protein n=1 Tax=Dyadobacter bucti TaxID=2572203 RepID=UPI0011081EB6|nr:phage antirepressor KilAC domain-containing protein [Dyadobacter bucti]
MDELIKVSCTPKGNQVVDGRELYSFLGPKSNFIDWIHRMFDYGFQKDVDYLKKETTVSQGVMKHDFILTLDCAKEIAMIQRSEKGKQARQYFIACEKRLKEIVTSKELSRREILQMALEAETEKEKAILQLNEATKQIEADKPKVAFADAVSTSETDILMRDLAKLIAQNGFVIGEHRLYEWMVVGGYLERRKRWSTKKNKYEIQYWPTQRAIDLKVFRVKETVIHEGSASAFLKPTVKVNGKGQQYFIHKFLSAQ